MTENIIAGTFFLLLGAYFVIASRSISQRAATANSRVVSWILKRNVIFQETQYRIPFILTGSAFVVFGLLACFGVITFGK